MDFCLFPVSLNCCPYSVSPSTSPAFSPLFSVPVSTPVLRTSWNLFHLHLHFLPDLSDCSHLHTPLSLSPRAPCLCPLCGPCYSLSCHPQRAYSVLFLPLIRHPQTPFLSLFSLPRLDSSPQNHSLRLKGLTLCCPHVSSPRLSGAPPSAPHFSPVFLLRLLSPLTFSLLRGDPVLPISPLLLSLRAPHRHLHPLTRPSLSFRLQIPSQVRSAAFRPPLGRHRFLKAPPRVGQVTSGDTMFSGPKSQPLENVLFLGLGSH